MLHCLYLVKKNLGWYMTKGVIVKKEAANSIDVAFQKAVKDLVPHLNDIVEAFSVPKIPELNAPIVRDYVKFNTQSDMENVQAAGNFFDPTKGPSQAKL